MRGRRRRRHRRSPTTQYRAAGATIAGRRAQEVFAAADMIVKVKEPQPQECAMLRHGQMLFTYLHLAPDPEQTAALVEVGRRLRSPTRPSPAPTAALPLLTPMSEVAGRMAIQAGAHHLEKPQGRHGRAARRRAGRGAGARRDPRRRRRRHATRADGGRASARASPSSTRTSTACASSTCVFGNRITTLYSNAHVDRGRRAARPTW